MVVESSLKRVYLMIVRGFGGSKICTLQANRLLSILHLPSLGTAN